MIENVLHVNDFNGDFFPNSSILNLRVNEHDVELENISSLSMKSPLQLGRLVDLLANQAEITLPIEIFKSIGESADNILSVKAGSQYITGSIHLSPIKEISNRIRYILSLFEFPQLESNWFNEIINTSFKMTSLPENWNSRGGKPTTFSNALSGLGVLNKVLSHIKNKPFIYPSPNGGIVFEFIGDNAQLTFLLESNNAIIHLSDHVPEIYDLSLSENEKSMIDSLQQHLDLLFRK